MPTFSDFPTNDLGSYMDTLFKVNEDVFVSLIRFEGLTIEVGGYQWNISYDNGSFTSNEIQQTEKLALQMGLGLDSVNIPDSGMCFLSLDLEISSDTRIKVTYSAQKVDDWIRIEGMTITHEYRLDTDALSRIRSVVDSYNYINRDYERTTRTLEFTAKNIESNNRQTTLGLFLSLPLNFRQGQEDDYDELIHLYWSNEPQGIGCVDEFGLIKSIIITIDSEGISDISMVNDKDTFSLDTIQNNPQSRLLFKNSVVIDTLLALPPDLSFDSFMLFLTELLNDRMFNVSLKL